MNLSTTQDARTQELEKRIADLETKLAALDRSRVSSRSGELVNEARFMALRSIVQDLAEQAGLGGEAYFRHFDLRFRWWHDYCLRQVEEKHPRMAAELDSRTIEQAEVENVYPPLFDPL